MTENNTHPYCQVPRSGHEPGRSIAPNCDVAPSKKIPPQTGARRGDSNQDPEEFLSAL
jgi:hypothetical protein